MARPLACTSAARWIATPLTVAAIAGCGSTRTVTVATPRSGATSAGKVGRLEYAERRDVVALLQAEAQGDARAMLAQLHGCDRRCVRTVASNARRLKRPG